MKKKTATRQLALHVGDCLQIMPTLPADSIDAIVCDPPYGLTQNKKGGSGAASLNPRTPAGRARIGTGGGPGGFMGQKWDARVPGPEYWREALRVAKPGAHLLAFGGTRTFHRLACAIEDAGWEIRDTIMWVYGSGFPKSLDVSKASAKCGMRNAEWQGWGTALKPAWEPIIVARKPLEGTVAENVLAHGAGGLNIDGCRIESAQLIQAAAGSPGFGSERADGYVRGTGRQWKKGQKHSFSALRRMEGREDLPTPPQITGGNAAGRWPANVIHDGSEEVVAGFPRSDRASGPHIMHHKSRGTGRSLGYYRPHDSLDHGDAGSAARFFYCAKATKRDRDEGLEHMGGGKKAEVFGGGLSSSTRCVPGMHTPEGVANRPVHYNAHPTVKPTALMRYLCRLVTPPGGVILDPFMGSGSTGKAAMLEGFRFIGIDLDRRWVKIARCRIAAAARRGLLDLDPRRSTLALGRASVRLLASKTGQLASAAKAGGKAK